MSLTTRTLTRSFAIALLPISGLFPHSSLYGQQLQDSLDAVEAASVFASEKNYWRPAVEVVGLNLGVWGFNRYLTRAGWSNISLGTVKENFRTGFRWDFDGYLMNQFMHPYHGSAYFSTARTNGLGFWESFPYAFGGSLMWEFFMEDEPPSYNDIVNTPVTGAILGEISLRVSDLIVDEGSGGLERVLRESAVLMINPVRGVKRLLAGDMWRGGSSRERVDYSLRISAGTNSVFFSRDLSNNRAYAFLGLDLAYGSQFDVSEHRNPFDYFSVHGELSFMKGDNIAGIFASGVLWDGRLALFGGSREVIGAYKEVDILINTVYKLSATSLTGQMENTIDLSSPVAMRNSLSLSAVLMGATNSMYATEFGKDYNIGPGASARISTSLLIKDLGSVEISYKRYWIHTLSGAAGEEFVGLLKVSTRHEIGASLSLGADFLLYERFGDYRDFPDTQTANSALRLYVQFEI